MAFSSLLFLYLLLPVMMLIYYLLPDLNKKNTALLVFSLVLYAMGQPGGMIILVAVSYLNFVLAQKIQPDDLATLIIPVAINVGFLAVVKYLDMLLNTAAFGMEGGLLLAGLRSLIRLLNSIGLTLKAPDTVVPVGLAFYTLSVLSYLLDVYREKVEAEKSFRNLLLYLMMFPKVFLGPIVRYEKIYPQFSQRKHHPRTVFEGFQRFLFGLSKKVLLADCCGRILTELSNRGADNTLVGVWFAAVLFMFQIYYHFSGFCDMAVGLGKMFGLRFCENFDRPYLALSVREFTRKWNMSVEGFFRDYVYLPLGGNRMGKNRQMLNMLLMWLLTGFWYGAGWNYVLWGMYIFAILVVEKESQGMLDVIPDWVCRCITLWLLLFGWIIFSHTNWFDLKEAMLGVLGYRDFAVPGLGKLLFKSLPLLMVCCVGCTNVPVYAGRILAGICDTNPRRKNANQITALRIIHGVISLCTMLVLLWLCTVALAGTGSLPAVHPVF